MPTRLLLLCCLCASLVAADGRSLKRELADCAKRAYQNGDLWTLLQIEAWAEANDIRSASFLTSSRVIGSPLLATPDDLYRIYDCGDNLVAITRQWIYRWAPDGRPLNPGIRKPGYIARHDVDPRGRMIATLTTQPDENGLHAQVTIAVDDFESGKSRWAWQRRVVIGPAAENLVMAADGSAVALTIRDDAAPIDRRYTVSVIREGRDPTTITGIRQVIAIGPGARWLIASTPEGPRLIRGDQRDPLIRWATGPEGRLAWVDGDQRLHLIAPDGSDTAIETDRSFNHATRLISRGPYLVLASTAATSEEVTDIFGETTTVEQNGSWSFHPWADCNAGLSPAQLNGTGQVAIDQHHPLGLILTQGQQLQRLIPTRDDDDQPAIASTVLYSGDHALHGGRSEGWYYRCTDERGHSLIVHETDGLLLDLPEEPRLDFGGRHHLLQRDDEQGSYTLHHLATDQAQRTATPLALPPRPDINVMNDVYGTQLAMSDQENVYIFSLPDVVRIAANRLDNWHYDRIGVWPQLGRFGDAGARLLAKQRSITWNPAEDPDGWLFSDAAHHPLGIVALLRSGQVVVIDKKGRQRELAQLESSQATFLTVDKDATITVCDALSQRVIGRIDRRGSYAPVAADAQIAAPPANLPIGTWQVSYDHQIFPPKLGRIDWPHERLPRQHLRSHPIAKTLLVVTQSVIIELSVNDAKRLQSLWDL